MNLFSKNFRSSTLAHIFWEESRKTISLFVAMLVPNCLAALFEGGSFALILLALNVLSGIESNLIGKSWIFSCLSISPYLQSLTNQQLFTFFVILAILSQVCRSGLSYLGQITSMFLGTRLQIEFQKRVYEQILRLSFPCVNRYKTGDLLEYAKIPPTLISVLIDPLNQAVIAILTILSSLCVMLFLSPSLTFLAFAIFGFLAFLQKFVIAKISRISTELSDHMVDFSKHTVQSLHALRVIHTFNRQATILERIQSILKQIAGTTKKLNLWSRSIQPINEMLGITLIGLFLIIGQQIMGESERAVLPLLLTFILIIHRMNGRIQVLLSGASTIAFNWGQIIRLEKILNSKDKEFSRETGKNFGAFDREILFRNVHLQYPNTKSVALSDLTLTIPKGKTVAFVGSSGAGKSSIMDLLVRLYDPSEGELLVDDVNFREYSLGSWREKLGVVSQDPFIFHETIEENIRFGLLEASFEQIAAAAKIAEAHEFIQRMPQGYQTIVGERGYRLSGGERQRLSLARALVRDPDILILDEATSNLDSYSEHLIQRSLHQFYGKKTIIIVAHRLSTIVNADRIYVLERGNVIEWGTHSELLSLHGRYSYLWTIQTKEKSPSKLAEVY